MQDSKKRNECLSCSQLRLQMKKTDTKLTVVNIVTLICLIFHKLQKFSSLEKRVVAHQIISNLMTLLQIYYASNCKKKVIIKGFSSLANWLPLSINIFSIVEQVITRFHSQALVDEGNGRQQYHFGSIRIFFDSSMDEIL